MSVATAYEHSHYRVSKGVRDSQSRCTSSLCHCAPATLEFEHSGSIRDLSPKGSTSGTPRTRVLVTLDAEAPHRSLQIVKGVVLSRGLTQPVTRGR